MARTSNDEWFMQDQAQWWDQQRQDEEELRQLKEQSLRDAIREELFDEVEREFLAVMKPRIDEAVIEFGKVLWRSAFLWGFGTALTGAILFIYLA